ncbi:hypothetical protein [Carboxylicivirga caseinilyticus]|uniref:hypothetical protein n=1 Tax=Carboxylicivirga caseinilyticus TaxID=3417572 RepID=UPI003D334792|nr:hypothetical protein [Marinilabiliaceae bacterium A049]
MKKYKNKNEVSGTKKSNEKHHFQSDTLMILTDEKHKGLLVDQHEFIVPWQENIQICRK